MVAGGDVAAEVGCPVAAPGDDVDHAADRVGAIQAGARTAQHLDALHLGQADARQVGLAQRRRANAHTVDQDQRVAGGAATDQHAGALPGAAVARELDAAFAAQQVFKRIGAGGADVVAVDDHDVGDHAVQRGRRARADDLHSGTRVGLRLREGQRRKGEQCAAQRQPRKKQ
jgi:hypothetical protein